MRVICIDKGTYDPYFIPLIVGETYTVIQFVKGGEIALSRIAPNDCYRLEELKSSPIDGSPLFYHAKNFIPLSSIDETEFERNYKKEPAWIEAFNKL